MEFKLNAITDFQIHFCSAIVISGTQCIVKAGTQNECNFELLDTFCSALVLYETQWIIEAGTHYN